MSTARPLRRVDITPDATILTRIADGDVAALGILYDRYAPALVRYTARFDRSDAEDVVQTVFMRVLRIAGTFRQDAVSARSWLYAITTHVLQERSRAMRRFGRALMNLSNDVKRLAVPTCDLQRDLERGIMGLPRAKSTVLLLNEVEGFTCEEISAMLEIPVGTVYTRLHHARRELRRYYDAEGDHEPR